MVFLILGSLIQLLGPFFYKIIITIMRKKYSLGHKVFKKITPQRIYDIVSIVGGIICVSAIYEVLISNIILNNNQIVGVFLCGAIGGSLPLVIWKIYNFKIIYKKGKINKDTFLFLPLVAVSEELVWRYSVPFLIMNFYESLTLSIFISSIGFLILHLPLGGMRSIPYMIIFTIGVTISYIIFGILAAIAFHIFHNLIINFFYPKKIQSAHLQKITHSETEW